MVLAHSFIGIPIAYYLIKDKKDFLENTFIVNFLYFIAIVGAVFPDFDLALGFFIHDLNHRKLISHSVVPYILLFIFVYIFATIFKKNERIIKKANLVFLVSVLSHLLLDFFVGGISLFAPISSNIYGYDIYFGMPKNFFEYYFLSWYMVAEVILISFSIFYMFILKNIKIVYLTFFFFLIALFMSYIYR